jgi:uncharacterized protein YoxC
MTDQRPTFSTRVQAWLGLDHIHTHLRALENIMAKATEQLTNLTGKVDRLIEDVRVGLNTINQDELSAEAQAALDQLTAKVDAFATEVGDRDGSDVVVPPVDPNNPGNPNI